MKATSAPRRKVPLCRLAAHVLCWAALVFSSACATRAQKRADVFLDRLCARGGLRVYENVILPPGLALYITESYTTYEPYRIYAPIRTKAKNPSSTEYAFRPVARSRRMLNPRLFDPVAGAQALGPDYQIRALDRRVYPATEDIPEGVEFWGRLDQIVRRADGKVLGETLSFERKDDSSWSQLWRRDGAVRRCPENAGIEALISLVFIQSPDSGTEQQAKPDHNPVCGKKPCRRIGQGISGDCHHDFHNGFHNGPGKSGQAGQGLEF